MTNPAGLHLQPHLSRPRLRYFTLDQAQYPQPLCIPAPPDSLPSFFPQFLVHPALLPALPVSPPRPVQPDRFCICDQAVAWMPLLFRKLDPPTGFLEGPPIAPDKDGLAPPATSAPSLPVEKWEHSLKYFFPRKTFCSPLSSSLSEPRLCEWSQGACASRGALSYGFVSSCSSAPASCVLSIPAVSRRLPNSA